MADAVKFIDAASAREAQSEFGDAVKVDTNSLCLLVETPEGSVRAYFDDWIVRVDTDTLRVVKAVN
ncbi:hypothetical protein ACWDBD_17450 [Streptomyces sp. NPDC001118]